MANQKHVDLLKKGVDAWNLWRQMNPSVQPNLSGTGFSDDAHLEDADFYGRAYYSINLRNANLSKTDLSRTRLIFADLTGANLSDTDLSEANLEDAHLMRADLSGANLQDANLTGVDLRYADLRYAHLVGANLTDADLKDTSLVRADLSQATLSRADLSGIDFRQINHNQTNFSKAKLRGANLSGFDYDLRRVNFSKADLSGSNLNGADLGEANLKEANLSQTNLRKANLSKADLRNAKLEEADLSGADLSGADLRKAFFIGTYLNHTILYNSDFSDALIVDTSFGDVDLRLVKGLDLYENRRYRGPSYISTSTLVRSCGEIPEAFLRGAGLDDRFIEYTRSLVSKAIEYYSCFISYSSKNEDFAERLFADLQRKGVRCWFAPEDLKIGDHYHQRIDESIRIYDKLILILSEHAIQSAWVEREVVAAREKEDRMQRPVLFPIRLDDAVMSTSKAWAADVRRRWRIGDFTRWKHHDTYQQAFERLLHDLKAEIAQDEK